MFFAGYHRVSKIAKDWCFLKHSQCWGSESCYQFHGWHWVGNAGIFHPTICSFNRWIDQHMGSHQGLGFLKKPSCSTGESSCSSLKWLYTAQHWCIGGKSLIFGGYPIETEKYTSNWWLNPLGTHPIKPYKNQRVHIGFNANFHEGDAPWLEKLVCNHTTREELTSDKPAILDGLLRTLTGEYIYIIIYRAR